TQPQQRRAPRALAAADVEHAAQRTLEVVLGGGDRERDLARQALCAADAAAAVPGVEIALVVAFGHGVGRLEAAATIARLFASVAARPPTESDMHAYLWIKSAHLLFVMAWVAAAFYLPRILINLVEAGDEAAVRARLVLMGRRLYRFGH